MKSNQKMTLLFYHKKFQVNKKGLAPLYCRISIGGSYEAVCTGKRVGLECWDIPNKRAINCSDAKAVNKRLAQIESDLDRHFLTLQMEYDNITPLMVKNLFDGKRAMTPKGKKQTDFIPSLLVHFANHVKEFEVMVAKQKRSYETLKQWRATQKKVKDFVNEKFKQQDILLAQIPEDFGDMFYKYLTEERKKNLKELAARGQLKKLKQVLKTAVAAKYLFSNPMEKTVCSGGDIEVIPLEFSHVENIWNKVIDVERLDLVRDAFIFQCFTGFAYQDICALSPDHIVKVGTSAERWLIKGRGKTAVNEAVPILPVVSELIEKYKSHSYCKEKNRLIPIFSNQRYNGYLKELAAICHIPKSLSELKTHHARHFFADFMLNVLCFPIEDVSKMMGHRNIRTTQRYVKVRKIKISRHLQTVQCYAFTKEGKLRGAA